MPASDTSVPVLTTPTESVVVEIKPLRPGAAVREDRWTFKQILTLVALTLGYTGFYLCRVNYSVSKPALLAEYGPSGLDKAALGAIDSAGTLCYAFGKIILGLLADMVSPKGVFIGAMAGSVIATALFASVGSGAGAGGGGRWGMMVAWCLNRSVQSAGWGALTKIASRWFGATQYGRAMAILALSYFFGDALARLLYGELLDRGMGWRTIYIVGAASLAGLAVLCAVLVRDEPPTPVKGSDRAVFEERADASKAGTSGVGDGLMGLLGPLLRSRIFWIAAVMSAGLTFARETFNAWTPLYLVEYARVSAADASRASALFPFFGGISVLVAGWVSDRMFMGRRGGVMVLMLAPAAACLVGLAVLQGGEALWIPLALISAIALGMLGPYAFLSGAIALDLGSKRGSATAAGLIDATGYFAGVMAGAPLAALVQRQGWSTGWASLAVAVVVVTVAAEVYRRGEKKAEG